MARVIDRDLGARRTTRAIKRLARGLAVSVGVHESEGRAAHPSGPTVAEVAAFAEFGTEEQPARPWLRSAVDALEGAVERELARAAEAVVRGRRSEDAAFEAVGENLADAVRKRTEGLEALDAETVARKGSATILEETGTMKRAIRARVRRLRERLR